MIMDIPAKIQTGNLQKSDSLPLGGWNFVLATVQITAVFRQVFYIPQRQGKVKR
jgi:hypothetical protein